MMVEKSSRLETLERLYRYNGDYTVKRGFPIILWYNLADAEPDIGIHHAFLHDYHITTRRGYDCEWLNLSEDEIDYLFTQVFNG